MFQESFMEDSTSTKDCILFADDSKTARAAVRKVLQSSYNVAEAQTGDDAWSQIENNDSIELIIADINMPDSNGLELLQKIRKSNDRRISQLPVIVITGAENSAAAMNTALKHGATDFIAKPFKGFDLLCRVQSYIELNKKIRSLESDLEDGSNTTSFQIEQHELYARKSLSFANRHKSTCSFGCIDIDVLNDIHTQHNKKVLLKIQQLISGRITHHLREEDLFSQISTHRFGLVMPATSQLKSQILLVRLIDVINAMSLEIGGENYRLSAKAGIYTRNGLADDDYDAIMVLLNDAVDRCKANNNNNKIIICGDNQKEQADVSASLQSDEIEESLLHVLSGEYHKIVDGHVKELSNKLSPFIQYANDLGNS